MTISEVSIGTVFKFAGSDELWMKVNFNRFRRVGQKGWSAKYGHSFKGNKSVEIVRLPETGAIRRVGDLLHLSEGDVQLEFLYPWLVRSATVEGKVTKFVLEGGTFEKSVVDESTEQTALPFTITRGSQHLGRPPSSMIFAYKGRVYARATQAEIHGQRRTGGWKRVKVLDGAPRLIIAGMLTLPEEGALHDVIQDHFGPGASQP